MPPRRRRGTPAASRGYESAARELPPLRPVRPHARVDRPAAAFQQRAQVLPAELDDRDQREPETMTDDDAAEQAPAGPAQASCPETVLVMKANAEPMAAAERLRPTSSPAGPPASLAGAGARAVARTAERASARFCSSFSDAVDMASILPITKFHRRTNGATSASRELIGFSMICVTRASYSRARRCRKRRRVCRRPGCPSTRTSPAPPPVAAASPSSAVISRYIVKMLLVLATRLVRLDVVHPHGQVEPAAVDHERAHLEQGALLRSRRAG